jgi:hypothetical protein
VYYIYLNSVNRCCHTKNKTEQFIFNENFYQWRQRFHKDTVHMMLLVLQYQMLLMMIHNNFNRLYEIEEVEFIFLFIVFFYISIK